MRKHIFPAFNYTLTHLHQHPFKKLIWGQSSGIERKTISDELGSRFNIPDEDSPQLSDYINAWWQDGIVLFFPPKETMPHPIHLSSQAHLNPNTCAVERNYIKVGPQSRVSLILSSDWHSSDQAWGLSLTNIHLENTSRLELLLINSSDEPVRIYNHLMVHLEENSQLLLVSADFIEGIGVVRREVFLHQRGGEARLRGVHIGKSQSHLDYRTRQIHFGDKTVSDLLFKSVLFDQSRSIYKVLIRVMPTAQ
ncbi:MAG: SufD family Fe-S cluster assembly protein, partial [bacterium]